MASQLRRIGGPVLVVIALLGVLGALAFAKWPDQRFLNLDRELSIPAVLSAALLAGCALMAARAARTPCGGWPLLSLAIFFAAMSLDELFALHEHLEEAAGIDWQLLYSPLILVAAGAFLVLAWDMLGQRALLLTWLAGALCWGVSQALEMLAWSGDERLSFYESKTVAEEVLEMTGSVLWLCVLAGLASFGRSRLRHDQSLTR